jgi:hypothetical protein
MPSSSTRRRRTPSPATRSRSRPIASGSARAAPALAPAQRSTLERAGFAIGEAELGEIEKAGGSLRCCVAEIF